MAVDPFAQYQNAFQSIVPPQGVSVPQTAPVQLSPAEISQSTYDKHLIRQGINPNTIGTATLNRDTGGMDLPSIAQEQLAIRKLNQANAVKGDLLRAAHWAQQRRDGDEYMRFKQLAREADNPMGGSGYESKLKYFLALAQANSAPSANGFAG